MGNAPPDVKVSYYTLMLGCSDEAISLANYLSQHGICAEPERTAPNEVVCPVIHGSGRTEIIEKLYGSWQLFWEFSDSTLLGLPVYTKH